jgi:hypothetical protein
VATDDILERYRNAKQEIPGDMAHRLDQEYWTRKVMRTFGDLIQLLTPAGLDMFTQTVSIVTDDGHVWLRHSPNEIKQETPVDDRVI